jgi:hypothetical protein
MLTNSGAKTVFRKVADHWGRMILRVINTGCKNETGHPGLDLRRPGLDPGSILNLGHNQQQKWIPDQVRNDGYTPKGTRHK